MNSKVLYLLAADAVLFLHALFVAFVILGLLLIFAGKFLSWLWVRSPWFRWAHLVGIGVVVIQSWLGVICPLTIWEAALRSEAGGAVYAGSFIAHWLETLLYYRVPAWAFVVAYTAFGLLVGFSWFWVRPRPFAKWKRRIAA